MSYTKNPHMPNVRRDAAHMVHRGFSKEEVGRRFGVGSSTICKWVKKARVWGYGAIPTLSSRPKHHPKELKEKVVDRIVALRIKTKRTSEVVHQHLLNEGIKVSLNSVRRTIDRHGLMKKRSKWKRYHPPVDRPYPLKSGDLVQIDTIHRMIDKKKRLYVFVLIDVYSRWIYAKAYEKMSGKQTIRFVNEAQKNLCSISKCCKVIMGQNFLSYLPLEYIKITDIPESVNLTTMLTLKE